MCRSRCQSCCTCTGFAVLATHTYILISIDQATAALNLRTELNGEEAGRERKAGRRLRCKAREADSTVNCKLTVDSTDAPSTHVVGSDTHVISFPSRTNILPVRLSLFHSPLPLSSLSLSLDLLRLVGELELCHFISKPDRWTKVNLATKFDKHNELSSDSLHVQHPHSEVVQDGRWIQDLRAQLRAPP